MLRVSLGSREGSRLGALERYADIYDVRGPLRGRGRVWYERDSFVSRPSSSSSSSSLLLLLLFFFFHRSGTIFPQSSSAKMRFSQVLSTAIAAGVTTAEPLANVLAANNNTLSTLNCKM